MNAAMITALISLLGTLIATFGSMITGAKLMNYRIDQLEKKVEKYSGMIERFYQAESHIEELRDDVCDIKRGKNRKTQTAEHTKTK